MMGAGIRAELPLAATIGRLIPHPALQAMFNANDRLLAYGTRAVESAKAQGTGGQGASVFAQLDPEELKNSAFPLTEQDIRVEAGNFIVAGADTTAIGMTYLTYAVLANPALREELENEVSGLPEGFGDRECEELPLLNAVVNETLRLYGAAPGSLPRTVPKGGANLVGHYLPEGTVVITQAWSLHRDERLWPEAERWVYRVSSAWVVAVLMACLASTRTAGSRCRRTRRRRRETSRRSVRAPESAWDCISH